ncbi:hypothetical protein [Halomonas getboli]|uniref:hypothetical protein n=1 Tax=Halomonas getboli TaxID=2935862 RepID=UPI001FFE3CE2|nr:hypothetical protein [Halomonas getboli]MCK2183540.1 hypothetical protein [Halomonas getboli]
MSYATPNTLSELYRRHGLATGISATVMQLHEYAMAVSLMGRYHADADYQGANHCVRLTIRTAPAGRLLSVDDIVLPRDDRPAAEAVNQLGAAIHRLTGYLMEGPLS